MATGSSAVKVTPNQKKVEQEEMIFRQVVVQAHHCLDSPLTSFKKGNFCFAMVEGRLQALQLSFLSQDEKLQFCIAAFLCWLQNITAMINLSSHLSFMKGFPSNVYSFMLFQASAYLFGFKMLCDAPRMVSDTRLQYDDSSKNQEFNF